MVHSPALLQQHSADSRPDSRNLAPRSGFQAFVLGRVIAWRGVGDDVAVVDDYGEGFAVGHGGGGHVEGGEGGARGGESGVVGFDEGFGG